MLLRFLPGGDQLYLAVPGLPGPDPGPLFAAKKQPEKPPACGWTAYILIWLRDGRALIFLPKVHACDNDGLYRLPTRLALSSYPSFSLDAYRLIHMKCGCETQ